MTRANMGTVEKLGNKAEGHLVNTAILKAICLLVISNPSQKLKYYMITLTWLINRNWCTFRIFLDFSMKWAKSRENLSTEVYDQVRLKLACSITEVRVMELWI